MPIYEYRCENGHKTTVRHRMDGADAPRLCQVPELDVDPAGEERPAAVPCNARLEKLISAPASSFPGAGRW